MNIDMRFILFCIGMTLVLIVDIYGIVTEIKKSKAKKRKDDEKSLK